MSHPVFYVPAGDVLPILFSTYDGGTGASITLTGLAVTDIEIYKDGGVTQRASDAGYTLLDTDGIDFDGITGIHGFSIDTGDDTDSGFYAVGAWYHVVVSAVTVDAQTVNFIAAAFRIMAAEDAAGVPDVNVTHLSGDSTAADNAEAFFDGTGYAGTNNVIPTVTNLTNAPTAGDLTATMKASVNAEVDTALADYDAPTNAEMEARTLVAASYATAANQTTIAGYIDTEVAAILAAVDTEVAAIKAVTDLLPDAGALSSIATAAALQTVDDEIAVIDGIVDDLKSGIIYGAAATGTLSTTQASTNLTGYADDQLIGRVVIWLSGAAEGEASDITDYALTNGVLTFTALTTAPGNGDTFKIV